MTNVDELFNELVELGQHPKEKADTVTVLEKIGHFLDEENDRLYYEYKEKGIGRSFDANRQDRMRIWTITQMLRDSAREMGWRLSGCGWAFRTW